MAEPRAELVVTSGAAARVRGGLAAPLFAPRPASLLALNLQTIWALLWRDLVRFFRQRSRVVGALIQPLIFWVVFGSGLRDSLRVEGGSLHYLFPGMTLLVVLFTSIFTSMSVIEDRHKGFLQAVLVAPASRSALVLGKTLGGVAIALAQAALFLALLPLAGFSLSAVGWPLAALTLLLISIGLSSMGFAIAWWLDSTQGYHVIMSIVLIPLWILSGAMFPLAGASPWIAAVMRLDPMEYALAALRRALDGGGIAVSALDLSVMLGFALVCFTAAVWISRPSRRVRRQGIT